MRWFVRSVQKRHLLEFAAGLDQGHETGSSMRCLQNLRCLNLSLLFESPKGDASHPVEKTPGAKKLKKE